MILLPVSGLDATLFARINGTDYQEVLGLPEREWGLELRSEDPFEPGMRSPAQPVGAAWVASFDAEQIGALEGVMLAALELLLSIQLQGVETDRMFRVDTPFPTLRVRVRRFRGTSWCELRVLHPPPSERWEPSILDARGLAEWLEVLSAIPGRVAAMFEELDRSPRAGVGGSVRSWDWYAEKKTRTDRSPKTARSTPDPTVATPPPRHVRVEPPPWAIAPSLSDDIDIALVEAVLAASPEEDT